MNHKPHNLAIRTIEAVLFNVKWGLNIFYLGLIVVLGTYAYAYGKEVYHLIMSSTEITINNTMLTVLEMVDVTMVANLVKMIITGSYNSFVSKEHGALNENISSGMLKVKMSTSIIGVSSIHLLQSFVSESASWEIVYRQIVIHSTFLIGALILAVIEYIHVKTEAIEHAIEHSVAHSK